MGASVRIAVAGLALLAAGCTSDPEDEPAPTPSASRSGNPVPTRELVVWADQVCTHIDLLEKTQREDAAAFKEILTPTSINPEPPDVAADLYLSSSGPELQDLSKGLEAIERTGIASADRLVARWAKQIDVATGSLSKLTDFFEVSGLEPEQKIERAEQAAKLIAELPRPESEFLAVVEKDRRLAAAHHLAPRCVPATTPETGPATGRETEQEPTPTRSISAVLPKAKDGTNVDACADGSCEILVDKTVDVRAGSFEVQLAFRDSRVTVSHFPPDGSAGEIRLSEVGSTGSFGLPDGATLTIEASGINQKGAVLKLTAT